MSTKSGPGGIERRALKRVRAPVFCRPVGGAEGVNATLWTIGDPGQKNTPLDISLGGMRVMISDQVDKNAVMDLELVLPDTTSMVCKVEVVWIKPLGEKHDVGLRFVDLPGEDKARLGAVLDAVKA